MPGPQLFDRRGLAAFGSLTLLAFAALALVIFERLSTFPETSADLSFDADFAVAVFPFGKSAASNPGCDRRASVTDLELGG